MLCLSNSIFSSQLSDVIAALNIYIYNVMTYRMSISFYSKYLNYIGARKDIIIRGIILLSIFRKNSKTYLLETVFQPLICRDSML